MKNFIQKMARDAGKEILKYYQKKQAYSLKKANEVVTIADLKSEKIITSAIRKKFPSHQILSEESGLKKSKSDFQWIIDPIDGTANFIIGVPLFCVCIALSHKGQITHGLEYFPALGEMYYAEVGRGTTLNNKKVKVSTKANLNGSFIMISTGRKQKDLSYFMNIHKYLKQHHLTVRGFSCAGVEFSLVASGRADAFVSYPQKLWDVAAGSLLIREAGGKITDFEGNEWNPKSNSLLVTNGKIHNDLLKMIKNVKR